MDNKVKWGILSTAQIAQEELLPAFQQAKNAEVIAIASANPKVNEIAKKFQIEKIYPTYDALLDDPSIEAVYIPLPNSLHREWVEKAAKKGKHILCEKPAALTSSEAEKMMEVCIENKVNFLEGFMYQFHPQHNRVKEIIASGEIGEPKIMKVSLSFLLENKGNNIRLNPQLGAGSMYDLGCYCLHSIRYLTEAEPTRLFVSSEKEPNNGVDMAIIGKLELENGMIGLFDAAMDRTRVDCYEIVGTEGSIRADRAFIPQVYDGVATLTIQSKQDNTRKEEIVGHQYVAEIEYISQLVINDEVDYNLMRNTILNMKAVDACFESMHKETFVQVQQTELNLSTK